MSRTIKFRAWNKREQKMVYAEEMKNSKSLWAVGFHGLPIAVDNDSFKGGEIIGWNIDHYLELMQSTGLKDSKGREIYEGDILKLVDATAKVVFWERPPAFGLDYSHNEDEWCEDWNITDDSERMEIIGNIYENHDLLQEQSV